MRPEKWVAGSENTTHYAPFRRPLEFAPLKERYSKPKPESLRLSYP